MFSDKAKDFISRAIATLPGGWFWLLIGLGLLANGQYLMYQREPTGELNPTLQLLNTTFRLEVVNIENAWLALSFMFIGMLIWGLFGSKQIPPVESDPAWTGNSLLSRNFLIPRIAIILLGTIFLLAQLAQHQYQPFLFLLWLGLLIWSASLFWLLDRSSGIKLGLGLVRQDLAWMLGLFVLSLTVSSFALTDIPNVIIPDEGTFWEAARAIATKEIQPAFFDFGVYTFPIASSIYQGFVMRMVGITLWGWRFSSVLAAILTTIPLYLLGKEWFGRRVAIVSVLAMLANPYFLVYARLGYNNAQTLLPVTLSIYLWVKALQKSSFYYLWLAGIVAGLGLYTYPAAWIAILVIIISAGLMWMKRRLPLKQLFVVEGVFLLAIAMLFAPRLVYGLSGQHSTSFIFKMLETTFANSFYAKAYYGEADLYHSTPPLQLAGIELYYEPMVYFEMLVRGFIRTTLVLFNPYIHQERFMVTPFTGVLTSVFFLIGLVVAFCNRKQPRFQILLVWALGGLFIFSVISAFPPSSTHSISTIPALALLSGVGVVAVSEKITASLGKTIRQWLQTLILMLLLLIIVLTGWQSYFVRMPQQYPPSFEDIASWIAWRTEDPVTIVYLGRDDTTPHRVEYLIDTQVVSHQYLGKGSSGFNWEQIPPNSIVFVEQQAGSIPTPPQRFNQAASYINPENHEVIGYAWTDTDTNLQPAPALPFSIRNFPVTIIPSVIVLAIMIFLLMTVQIRVKTEKMDYLPGFRIQTEFSLRNQKTAENQKET